MTYQEIIQAVKNGKKVHWSNASYTVIIDSKGTCMISYLDQNYVELSEEILNAYYDSKDFYLSPF